MGGYFWITLLSPKSLALYYMTGMPTSTSTATAFPPRSAGLNGFSAGLLYMVGQYEVQWGQLSAGVILSTVPVAVLFVFLQRHLIHGLTAGAVKG